MPFITVHTLAGKAHDYKKSILDGVHNALVRCFGIPEHDRMQCLIEIEPQYFETVPYMGDDPVIVKIMAFAGRSAAAKEKLFRQIVENLEQKPGIPPSDVFIMVEDVPRENWGIRGGYSAAKVKFDFQINV